jgi:hypothetical protein
MDSNRDETAAERNDRNWLDLIQELRVAPVAKHRFLFGRRQKDVLVPMVFYALVWVALPMSLLRQEGSY